MKKVQLHSFKGENRLVFFGKIKKGLIMFPVFIPKKDSKIVANEFKEKILSNSESGGIVMNLSVDSVRLYVKKDAHKICLKDGSIAVYLPVSISDASILFKNFKNHKVKAKDFDYYSFM